MTPNLEVRTFLVATAIAVTLGTIPAQADDSLESSPTYSLRSVPASSLDEIGPNTSYRSLFLSFGADADVALEEHVEKMYADFSMIASWSGELVSCDVSHFTHRTLQGLQGVHHKDLITNPMGIQVEATLLVEATSHTPSADGASKALDKPTLAEKPKVELSLGTGQSLDEYSELSASVMPEIVESFHDGLRVTSVSSFDVSCTSTAWNSEHRASLFLLRPEGAESSLTLDLQDPVLNVTTAIAQAAQQLHVYAKGPSISQDLLAKPGSLDKVGECLVKYENEALIDRTVSSDDRHNTGNHKLDIDSRVRFICSSSCLAECRPHLASSSCSDFGDPSGFGVTSHKVRKWASGIDGVSSGGTAFCGYAASCGVGECKFGLCGGEAISATWSSPGQGGGGFSFQTSASNFDEIHRQGLANNTCTEFQGPGCQELQGPSKLAVIDLARPKERGPSYKTIMSVDYPLTRSVKNYGGGRVTSWLIGEAAVVSANGGKLTRNGLVTSSLARFAVQADSQIFENLPAKTALSRDSDYLLIVYPEHPPNSLHTTPPSLEVDGMKRLQIEEEGRFVVSTFFEPDGRLRTLQLVQILGGFESFRAAHRDDEAAFFAFGDLVTDDLVEMLSVESTSEKQHASVVTAVVNVSSNGAVQLDDFFSYIPKCCCGGVHCV